jgi:hypothetical protein
VSEWHAATFPEQWPFYILAIGSIWLTARKPRALSLFEHLALVGMALVALDAIRNLVWFALVAAMVVPRALDEVWPVADAPIRRRVNILLSGSALVVIAASLAIAAGRAQSWYASAFPERAADAVARAADADPSLRVFANEEFADWLLWKVPRLSGRVAYDARFELMTRKQLQDVVRFRQRGFADQLAPAAGYTVLVLDPTVDGAAIHALRRQPGTTVLYRDPDVAVFRRATQS